MKPSGQLVSKFQKRPLNDILKGFSTNEKSIHSQDRKVRSIFNKESDLSVKIGLASTKLSKPVGLFQNNSDLDTPAIEDFSEEAKSPSQKK